MREYHLNVLFSDNQPGGITTTFRQVALSPSSNEMPTLAFLRGDRVTAAHARPHPSYQQFQSRDGGRSEAASVTDQTY